MKNTLKRNLPRLFSILQKSKRLVLDFLISRQRKKIPLKIEEHYKHDSEVHEIISFLKSHPVEMIPYFFPNEYKSQKFTVFREDDLKAVTVNGNTIYFPMEMTDDYIIDSVTVGLIEQDKRSPHRYLPIERIDLKGETAILCGASDCIYALQIINSFKKIYLCEANPVWIKPIKKTLKDYLHKIEIIPYFISDQDTASTITLDSFFQGRNSEKVDYIQADIEGDELKMLRGAEKLIKESANLKMSICCYHTAHQQSELTDFLEKNNFKVSHSDGFLLMWMDYPLKPPYLRRGVLYATR